MVSTPPSLCTLSHPEYLFPDVAVHACERGVLFRRADKAAADFELCLRSRDSTLIQANPSLIFGLDGLFFSRKTEMMAAASATLNVHRRNGRLSEKRATKRRLRLASV
jgi:hypothetical protein